MSTHNIGFYEVLTKIIFELSSNIIKYSPYFFAAFFMLSFSVTDSLLPGGARWPSGRALDSEARGWGFKTYLRCVVSLSKDTFTPRKVLVIIVTQEALALSQHG